MSQVCTGVGSVQGKEAPLAVVGRKDSVVGNYGGTVERAWGWGSGNGSQDS